MWLDIAFSLLQDYPSLAQLHEKLQESDILPIFAVVTNVVRLYQVAILLFILFSFIFHLYFNKIILINKWFTVIILLLSVIQETCFFKWMPPLNKHGIRNAKKLIKTVTFNQVNIVFRDGFLFRTLKPT